MKNTKLPVILIIAFSLFLAPKALHAQGLFQGGSNNTVEQILLDGLKNNTGKRGLRNLGRSQNSRSDLKRFGKESTAKSPEKKDTDIKKESDALVSSNLETYYTSVINAYIPQSLNLNTRVKTHLQHSTQSKKTIAVSNFVTQLLKSEKTLNKDKLKQAITDFMQELPEAEVKESAIAEDSTLEPTPLENINTLIYRLMQVRSVLSLAHLKRITDQFSQTAGILKDYSKEEFPSRKQTEGNNTLKQFGYDIFSQKNPFEVEAAGIINEHYVIGPGDQFTILLWGGVDEELIADVTREGFVHLSPIGKIQVSGLSFNEARKLIKERIKGYYKNTQPNVSISLGEIRGINAYVTGEVNRPGLYLISAKHTISSLIFLAGGIKKTGTLRDIKIKRGESIISYDAYSLLLGNTQSRDLTLRDGDVVMVPTIGPTCALVGAIIKPAIYEVKDDETVGTLLDFAGNNAPNARKDNLILLRTTAAGKGRELIDIKKSQWASKIVNNGDVVAVRSLADVSHGVVTIKGEIFFPGSYAWQTTLKLSSLVKKAGGITPRAYMKYGVIYRQHGIKKQYQNLGNANRQIKRTTLSFNLQDIINKKTDIDISPMDEILIYNRDDIQPPASVYVAGEVKNPGKYHFRAGMRIIDLVFLAGGLNENASLNKAALTRIEQIDGVQDIKKMTVDLRAIINRQKESVLLQPGDELVISKAVSNFIHVEITGEVNLPGRYRLKRGDRISDLLQRANGFTSKANPQGTAIYRESVKAKTRANFNDMADRLEKNLMLSLSRFMGEQIGARRSVSLQGIISYQKNIVEKARSVKPTGRIILKIPRDFSRFKQSLANIELGNNDRIIIPETPNTISVAGEVINPNNFVWQPHATVSSYLNMAGGTTEFSNKKSIYIVRASGEIITSGNVYSYIPQSQRPYYSSPRNNTLMRHLKNNQHKELSLFPIQPGDTIFIPQKTRIKISKLVIFRAFLDDVLKLALVSRVIENR